LRRQGVHQQPGELRTIDQLRGGLPTFAARLADDKVAPRPGVRLSWVERVKPTPNRSFDGPSRVSDRSQETATDALGQPLDAAEYFIIIRTRLANRVPRSKIKNEGSKLWPISHRTGRSNALPSSRLPMDKVTRLDA